jgi:hypothetical protein
MILDQLFVEVADFPEAARLTRRLGQTRTAAVLGEDPYVVTAAFSSEPVDLAELLREIESWVEDEGLFAIRFLLDDRVYVLEAGEADWDAAQVLRRQSSLSI